LVACGSTGEAAALDEDEQHAVLDTVLAAARGRPVLMGLTGSHAGQVQQRLQRFAHSGAAAFLVSAPPYVRPSQAGLLHWFIELAELSPRPITLYDIPYRTGVRIEADTALTLASHPNIVAMKDCGGDPVATQRLIADGRLQLLAGEDAQIFTTLCWGGAGAIAASAHVRPDLFVALHRAVAEQRLADARRFAHALAPLIRALFSEPSPGPLKALLAHDGLLRNELRAPLAAASDDTLERLLQLRGALDADFGRNALHTASSVSR